MSVLLALTVGLLVALAVLQLLQRDVFRMVVGLFILWNAVNLSLIAIAGAYPVADGGAGLRTTADPLLQAMILTAIIITFGFLAVLLTLAAWLAHAGRSTDERSFRSSRE